MSWKSLILMCTMMATVPTLVNGAGMADYLILQDIGIFKISKPEKVFAGDLLTGGPRTFDGAALVSGAGHFRPDHTDTTYEVKYYDFSKTYPSPTVQVTQHAGGDSDKWLLHELENYLRQGKMDKLGRRSESAGYRSAGNTEILRYSGAGKAYLWISNYVTVYIKCGDTVGKPEPIEVVQAYLNKFPPTLPPNYKRFNTSANDIVWIKDEIDRRLWLCDKWFGLVVADDPKLGDKLKDVVKSMKIFLDYRERYFGIAAKDEKVLLERYLAQKDEASLRAKLAEYKKWWGENKGTAISF